MEIDRRETRRPGGTGEAGLRRVGGVFDLAMELPKKRFSGGGFGFRGGLQIFDTAMSCPVGRGCHAVLFAEEFD